MYNYDVINFLQDLDRVYINAKIHNESDRRLSDNIYNMITDERDSIFVGEGTNRAVFIPKFDMDPIFRLGIPQGDYVFKIPHKLTMGAEDNVREVLAYAYIENNKHISNAVQYLEKIVPKAFRLLNYNVGINHIIMQEEVLTYDTMKRFDRERNKEEAWKDYIKSNKDLSTQHDRLMDALDSLFVMSDMSFDITPSNYGIKIVSGKEIFVPLDLGHVIPKYGKKIKCPVCGSDLKYTHMNDRDILNSKEPHLINMITLYGYYRCSDIECVKTNYRNSAKKSLIYDINVFDPFVRELKKDRELIYNERIIEEI